MQLESSGDGQSVKSQVVDKIPKRFKELKFGVQYAIYSLDKMPDSKAYYLSGRIKTLSIKQLWKLRIVCSMTWRRTEPLFKMEPWMEDWWAFLNMVG